MNGSRTSNDAVVDMALRYYRYRSYSKLLSGKIMYNMMFEKGCSNSYGYETAMYRMGGNVVRCDNVAQNLQHETVSDILKRLVGYADIFVVNHDDKQQIHDAKESMVSPIVHGGMTDYYTHAMTDLMTIKMYCDMDRPCRICFIGDVSGNDGISYLFYILSQYSNIVIEICAYPTCDTAKYPNIPIGTFRDRINEFDVVYCVPLSNISKCDYHTSLGSNEITEKMLDPYTLTMDDVHRMKPTTIIMHPLPNTRELVKEVDNDERSVYFIQSTNAIYVQMAILYLQSIDMSYSYAFKSNVEITDTCKERENKKEKENEELASYREEIRWHY